MAPPIEHDGSKKVKKSLEDIFAEEDVFGLLNVKAKTSKPASPEISKFEEINAFIDANARLPSENGDLTEKSLARRLSAFRKSFEQYIGIKEWDRHNLLSPVSTKAPTETTAYRTGTPDLSEEPTPAEAHCPVSKAENAVSLEDIFAGDDLGLLEVENEDLFDLKHVEEFDEKNYPDEIAERKTCKDFYQFETLFRQVHERLASGTWTMSRFQRESQTSLGDMFVLNGVLCLVDDIGEYAEDSHGRPNPRLRVIYENGTESNLLLRSLNRALYKDETARKVIQDAKSVEDRLQGISHKDKRSGLIYIVSTKSANPELAKVHNLHKIGYTELTAEQRTKNAEDDVTFLEAPVRILTTFECFNINPQKFEALIHGFLHAQRLSISLTSKTGKAYRPREWFSVPLDTAREVAKRIIDGTIVNYRMDNTTGRIVPKSVDLSK